MLSTLILPLLFSMLAGTFIYRRFPERRPRALLILTLFQLVGASGYVLQADPGLFTLLAVHATLVFFLLIDHLQAPIGVMQRGR